MFRCARSSPGVQCGWAAFWVFLVPFVFIDSGADRWRENESTKKTSHHLSFDVFLIFPTGPIDRSVPHLSGHQRSDGCGPCSGFVGRGSGSAIESNADRNQRPLKSPGRIDSTTSISKRLELVLPRPIPGCVDRNLPPNHGNPRRLLSPPTARVKYGDGNGLPDAKT